MKRFLAMLLLIAAPAAAASLTQTDGTSVEGSLVRVTAEQVVVKTAAGNVTIDAKKVRSITERQPAEILTTAGTHALALEDGSVIAAKSFTIADGTVTAAGAFAKITIDAEKVSRLLRPRAAETLADILKLRDKAKLQRGDKDTVLVRDAADVTSLQGIVQSLGDDLVLNYEGADTRLPAANVPLIEFAALAAKSPAVPVGDVILTDGSRVAFTSVEAKDAALVINSPTLGKVEAPANQLAAVRFRSTAAGTFLADLKPAAEKHTPFFGDAPPLTPAVTVAEKSLLIRARTERTYDLAGNAKSLTLQAAINPATPHGKATLTILLDDKPAKTIPLAGREKPTAIDLDLTNAKSLRLVVDFAENTTGSGATVLLIDPLLTK